MAGTECKHRLTLEGVSRFVSIGEELAGADLILENGGCWFAARDFSVNPPYCAYPDKSDITCPITLKFDKSESR